MMKVYKTPSKESQEIILANVTYKEVIEGLNGYFASEPRNDYITVKMESDKQNFALYEAEAWADILISWLRTKHEIFYYPGMEAKYAKMERIPPFTERMTDEGAYNTLKALHKRVTGKETSTSSHTLIADNIKYFVNEECKATGRLMVADYEKELLKFIYKEYKNRTRLSDKIITYNPPSVRNTITKTISDYARSRTRVDILEGRIKSIFDKYKTKFTVDDYVLNGDPTSKFMLDCISSWIDSPAESRGKTRAEIENYKLKLKEYILKDIKKHGYRYDGLETKSIEDIVDRIITMATLDRSNITLRDIYTTVASPVERLRYRSCDGATVDHMKEYILRRFESLNTNTEYCLKKMAELDKCHKDLKTLEEQRDEFMKQNAILAIKVDAKDDEISRLKDLINAMNEEVKDM